MNRLRNSALILMSIIFIVSCATKQEETNVDIVEITPSFTDSVHQYDALFPFSEGLAAVKKGDKFGFINTQGELVIPCQYSYVGPFKDGLAFAVADGDKPISFINKEGNLVETKYPLDNSYYLGQMQNGYFDDSMLAFKNGVCEINYSVKKKSKYQTVYINRELKEVSEPVDSVSAKEDSVEYMVFSESSKDMYGDEIDLKGVKDKTGEVVIPAKYNNIVLGDNGVAVAVLFAEDAESHLHPYRPYGMEMYGYVDFNGNSTFTEADKGKLDGYSTAQKEAFAGLKDKEKREQEQEQAQKAEEQQRYVEEEEPRVREERSSRVKEVYLEYTTQFGSYESVNGNYGWELDDFAGLMSKMIKIPQGKKWVFKSVSRNMDGRIFTYTAHRGDGKLYHNRTIEVSIHTREPYTFYSGDNIQVAIKPILDNVLRNEKIVFTFIEKSEYE